MAIMMCGADVHGHHDVRADRALHADRGFGRKQVREAVHVAVEDGAFFFDLAEAREREDLEAARVGEHRTGPIHELVDAPQAVEDLFPGAQEKVVGVREQDLRTRVLEDLRPDVANRGLRADRHEERREDFAVQGLKAARAGAGARRFGLDTKLGSAHAGSGFRIRRRSSS